MLESVSNLNVISNIEYVGIIRSGINTADHEGRYLVHIEELTAVAGVDNPIWAKNEITGNRFTRWVEIGSNIIKSSGQYTPLKTGMNVNVRFRTNSLTSAYITNIIAQSPLPDSPENRDTFYLLNKTENGSWIYQDDARDLTHISHNDGASNITLNKDRVLIHTGSPINGGLTGVLKQNALEVAESGTTLEFGKSSIYLNDTGITFRVGDTMIAITENGIKVVTPGKYELETGSSIKLKSSEYYNTASNEINNSSNVVRTTGNTRNIMTGNEVQLSAQSLVYIQSQINVQIEALARTTVKGSLIEVLADLNVYMTGQVIDLSSTSLVLEGDAVAIGSSVIQMDGLIMASMGLGSAVSAATSALNITLSKGMDIASLAMATATGFNDPITATMTSAMSSQIPGSANPTPGIVAPIHIAANIGSDISEKMRYIKAVDASYGLIVQEQFKNLRSTHEFYS